MVPVLALVFGGFVGFGRPAAASHRSGGAARAALRLLDSGLGGTYEATYRVSGAVYPFPGPSWTVVVDHRGPAQSTQWLTGGGDWAFRLKAGHGFQLRWIERGARHVDCWRRHASGSWHCAGGRTQLENGDLEATLPYVPGTVFDTVAPLVRGAVAGSGSRVVRRGVASRFGTLTCITVTAPGKTGGSPMWCFTTAGLPARVRPGATGESIALVSLRSGLGHGAFVPPGRPRGHALPPL